MALHVVTGPPAAGKSTFVANNAQPGDIIVDFDLLAQALTPPNTRHATHDHPAHLIAVTKAARTAAITTALHHAHRVNVWVIHSTPSRHTLDRYRQHGATIHTIDPGRDVTLARCRQERPHHMTAVAARWYDDNTTPEVPTSRPW